MTRLLLATLLLGVVFLAPSGCAVSVPRRAACEPPGAPTDWRTWPVVRSETLRITVDDGSVAALVVVRHERGGRAIRAGWARGRLVGFDPDAHAPGRPALYDAGAIDRRQLRAQPGPCRWVENLDRT